MWWQALGSGLTGALQLTALHETARRKIDDAPQMNVYGMRAISKSMEAVGATPPDDERLHQMALVGDILTNTLYYSLVALGGPKGAIARGGLLGLAAGIGAVVLPRPMGLGEAPSNRTRATQAMAIGWYLVGGLAAGAAFRLVGPTASRNSTH